MLDAGTGLLLERLPSYLRKKYISALQVYLSL